ncbi:uncharacterized protein SAPINGB_P001396 [Magnusiomyces paraingens]|uniref:Calcineurin-like phosphoesterase domain-containing protein n=1 Tax=Magnusiomyces paraingens TaxID=2606893 RepID=A0A5E8BBP2_9ASCO|nr:uncharacterized protein SAPINGB_P001396 [Saprochaete ingens]VVT46807.1 unnamed protein product [Saprochaete ingens]
MPEIPISSSQQDTQPESSTVKLPLIPEPEAYPFTRTKKERLPLHAYGTLETYYTHPSELQGEEEEEDDYYKYSSASFSALTRTVIFLMACMIMGLVYVSVQMGVFSAPVYMPVPDLIRINTMEKIPGVSTIHRDQNEPPIFQDATTTSTDAVTTPPVHSALKKSRMILVGDVHGNIKYLKQLMDKVNFNPEGDELVLLGDMISKGPDSLGVLNYAISVNASCVRGNHEDTILRAYSVIRRLPAPKVEPISNYELIQDLPLPQIPLDEEEDHDLVDEGDEVFENFATSSTPPDDDDDDNENDDVDGGSKEYNTLKGLKFKKEEIALARSLKPEHIEFLGTCSLILDLGRVAPKNTRAVAVHAGLQWNIRKLYRQHPLVVMTMRFMNGKHTGHPLENKPESKKDLLATPIYQWSKVWSKKQHKLPKSSRVSVFYGHDARHGLKIRDYTFGLDSNCVGGAQLSAMVISQNQTSSELIHEVIQVSCA